MKLSNLLKKDTRSKKEIYEKAISSFDFDYSISKGNRKGNEKQENVAKAIKCIPREQFNLQQVDYFA